MAEYAVEQQVRMRMVEPAPAYRLTVWAYDPADPYAVSVRFGGDVVWTFARHLLDAGLTAPAGDGDVRVRPEGTAVLLELESPDGRMLLVAAWSELRGFLAATYLSVPPGCEPELDVDAAVARVLEEAERC